LTAPPLTLRDLGEFGTIARIREWLDSSAGGLADASVRVGPGDDVAVTRPPEGQELLLTCDVQIVGRHFVPAWMTAEEIGRRALEVNLSDIAAKGGEVLWVLVSLGLAPEFRIDQLEQIYRGILSGLGSGSVVGGNLTSCHRDHWFLDITVVGATPIGRAAVRSGAQVGDLVFVTGSPGSAAAGLEILRALERSSTPSSAPPSAPSSARKEDRNVSDRGKIGSRMDIRDEASRLGDPFAGWVNSFLCPRARLGLGRALVSGGHVHAMLDVSDGILGDLFHLCESSRVSTVVELEALAFATHDSAVLQRLGVPPGDAPWRWILGPSDDYELLFTAHRSERQAILALGDAHNVIVREIGEVRSGEPSIELRGGKTGIHDHLWTPDLPADSPSGGWDHFGPSDTTP